MILLVEDSDGQEVVVHVRRIEEKSTSTSLTKVVPIVIDEDGNEEPFGDIDLNKSNVRLLPNG